MTTKKSTATAKSKRRPVAARQPFASHLIDALLHTVRSIAQYEDALCELAHEARCSDTLSAAAGAELRAILEKMPAHDYVMELEMARDLAGVRMVKKKRPGVKKAARRAAKKVAAHRGSAAPKKNSGRKSSK